MNEICSLVRSEPRSRNRGRSVGRPGYPSAGKRSLISLLSACPRLLEPPPLSRLLAPSQSISRLQSTGNDVTLLGVLGIGRRLPTSDMRHFLPPDAHTFTPCKSGSPIPAFAPSFVFGRITLAKRPAQIGRFCNPSFPGQL